MTIAPTKAPVHLLSMHRDRSADDLPSVQLSDAATFGSILAGPPRAQQTGLLNGETAARRDDRPHQPKYSALATNVDIAAQRYSGKAAVADDAVAFQARPLVAPSAVAMDSASLMPSADPARLPADTIAPSVVTEALNTAPLPVERAGPSPFATVAGLPVIIASFSSGNSLPIPNMAEIGPATDTGATTGQSVPPDRTASEPVLQARQQRQPPSPAKALADSAQQLRAQIFAHLVASAQEYRVTIKGAALAREDQDRLASEIRAALQEHGLPDRPVLLIAREGNT